MFGVVPQGTAAVLKVGVGDTADTLVGAVVTYDYTGDRQTTEREYYNAFPSTTTVGPAKRTMNFTGDYAQGDDGQAIVKDAFDNATDISGSVAPNGTDGESLPSRVSQYKIGGPSPNGPPSLSFNLNQRLDPTVVGAGL